ncbi:MAG: 5-guanidino-2-oxopentanoate decarboxylase [Rhizobiaceae bacterium]|nr:5-guanidino-2-oxopentanoate decarboxylase [Rhizobiaceae bacterium]
MISVGEATMRLLARYGVKTIFGIPGVHTLEFYRGLAEGSAINHVQARNEMGAGFMADGYARSTGEPGVALTISGPGVTNAATALGQSYADSIPLLLISAEARSDSLGKGWGVLHEVNDLNAVTRPLTAFSACARTAKDIPNLMGQAFSIFASQRPRPVHISIPTDVLEQLVEDDWKPVVLPTKPQPHPDAIAAASDLLARAKRPLILIGGGAVEADIKSLAERLGAVVISSNAGKGIIPSDHPLNLGGSICLPAAHELIGNADVVLAIGTELSETDSYIEELPIAGDLIRIDIDPAKMNDRYPAQIGIISDALPATIALIEKLGPGTPVVNAAIEVADIRGAIPATLNPTQTKHIKLLEVIRAALPDNAIIMGDACQVTYSASFGLHINQARRWHYASGYCALGFAFPNAIGAKLAQPDIPVLAIAGDGGSMFSIQELITAAQHKLPIPLILWHNNGYQQIRDDMREGNYPHVGVDPLAPDFPALALAMHCHATEPSSADMLAQHIATALVADRPTVIVVTEDSGWLS